MKAVGVFFVLLLAISACVAIFGDKRKEDEIACAGGGKISAFVMSQTFVTRQLKAPKTAEYPYVSDDGVRVVYQGGCKYIVRAYVDAQNSFSAKIRSRYEVELEALPGTQEWRATRVEIR